MEKTQDNEFLNASLGRVEIRTTEWREGDDLVLGGYSIHLDRFGREMIRTKNEENCRIVGWFAPECWK